MMMAVVLRSDLLRAAGFTHGFSQRLSDGHDAATECRRRLARAVGCERDRLYESSQVHGANVLMVDGGIPPEDVRPCEADALVALRAGDAVAVRVADCLPLIIADPVSGAVAAVHAGWRGVVAGVVHAAAHALSLSAGTNAGKLVTAIGPHIRVCCFEVGENVASQIAAAACGARVVYPASATPHVDLAAAVRAQLAAAGIASVDDVGGCTRCEPERFFSYRRDGARSGRQFGVIVARAPEPQPVASPHEPQGCAG